MFAQNNAAEQGPDMNKTLCLVLSGMLVAAPLVAETPAGDTQFTFKRVKPPAAGAAKRITVQVAPRANPAVIAPPDSTPQPESVPVALPTEDSSGRYGWYWTAVSPDIASSGPGRLPSAVAALQAGPDGVSVQAPRLQAMQQMADAYGRDMLIATVGTAVSPALALAVASVESGGDPTAESPKGAHGLMQLIPDTAARFGVEDASDPAQNIAGGVKYLDWLMGEFDGDPVLVLAAYNAGEGAVRRNDGVPPYAETRDYVPKVLAAWTVAQGLCLTPPELISDGCVFTQTSSN